MSDLVCCKGCGRDTRDRHGYCGQCRGDHRQRREVFHTETARQDDDVQEMVKQQIERMIGNSSD